MAKLDVMLWNKERTESVRASKIRSFGVYHEHTISAHWDAYKLLGWYNQDEYFYFGWWENQEQAQEYLENIHAQIEGRQN
jgi:hypothetical protein